MTLPTTVVARALGWMLGISAAGLLVELVLAKHYEDAWQWVPLVLLALVLCGALAVRNGLALRTWQALMVLVAISGGVGVVLHLKGKMEFALERAPDLHGLPLLLASLKGAAPPVLAPGAMVLLGGIGLLWALARPSTS